VERAPKPCLGKVVQLLVEVELASLPPLRLFERPGVATGANPRSKRAFFTESLSRVLAVLVVAR
jgi:hypothetical protein